MLSAMGIQHENEKVLEETLVVDVFIPSLQCLDQSNRANQIEGHRLIDDRGTVLEIDGPLHYDSYLHVRTTPRAASLTQFLVNHFSLTHSNRWEQQS
jgi:hypothetical protein